MGITRLFFCLGASSESLHVLNFRSQSRRFLPLFVVNLLTLVA